MKGHIRKRGNKSWAIVLDLGRDASGKRRQKWHSVKGNKKDAEAKLTALLNSLNVGDYVEPSRMRFSEYLDKWLADYAKHNVSPKTYERYADIIRNNVTPALGGNQLSKLHPLQLQGFYSDMLTIGRKDGKGGLSGQTVLHFHRLLHKALAQAVKWQLLARNPADAVEPPRAQQTHMRALDEKETAQLFRLIDGMGLYIPVVLAVTTGMRRGEILGLRWQDVNLETETATVVQSLEQTRDGLRFKQPKTNRSKRAITLPTYTVEILRTHKAKQAKERLALGPAYHDHGLVCARAEGAPTPPDTLSTNFASFVRRSGLPHLRFHDLRHTHATQLLKHGIHPKVVSERLGHSKIGITLDTYSHVMPGMQEEAAQKMDTALRVAMEKKND